MGDKNLNELLKWSLANSAPPNNSNGDSNPTGVTIKTNSPSSQEPVTRVGDNLGVGGAPRGLNPEALSALFGGPSEAELMQTSMQAITSPAVNIDDKLVAFDNFEQLIESLDNSNLLEKLGLWSPLLEQLGHEHAEMRRMAAWCVGTAVQNNEKCQERLLALGGVERLINMAIDAKELKDVRKKTVYAISSAVRNYQPAMNVVTKELERSGKHVDGVVDAKDMDAVDKIIGKLRVEAQQA